MKKILFLLLLCSCKPQFELHYKSGCSRGNEAFYFIHYKTAKEYSVVDTCGSYEYGKKVSFEWIKNKNKTE